MKVIIAGSRHLEPTDEDIRGALRFLDLVPTEIVSGMAPGVDLRGCHFAKANDIPVKEMPADWDRFGKRAGYLRNRQMGDYGDCLVAFWDGKSRGTDSMIGIMKNLKKPYQVFQPKTVFVPITTVGRSYTW